MRYPETERLGDQLLVGDDAIPGDDRRDELRHLGPRHAFDEPRQYVGQCVRDDHIQDRLRPPVGQRAQKSPTLLGVRVVRQRVDDDVSVE